MPDRGHAIQSLREAWRAGNLTLYLGAGVSVGNGLPTWERLVLATYFSAIKREHLGGWRPYPNYLYAIAEWHLERGNEPLDITARKIRRYLKKPQDFLQSLRQTLYAGFLDPDEYESARFKPLEPGALRAANSTLDAVARLCETRRCNGRGVKSVISYNYDCLLETVLHPLPVQPIWKPLPFAPKKLPVYHVHGYVPIGDEPGSTAEEIVFTEEQYHQVAQDAYSWSNLAQIQCMSSSVGLMVGLSLSDRNIRRLLDAVNKTPVPTQNYAFLQEPRWKQPAPEELDRINEKAITYMERFERSGVKRGGVKGPTWQSQIMGILEQLEQLGRDEQTFVLEQLGIRPVWYREHGEIPDIVSEIIGS